MCIAIPMKLVDIKENQGIAELGGIRREINIQMLENAEVGDYVITHAGFAIQKLDRKEAEETLDFLRELTG